MGIIFDGNDVFGATVSYHTAVLLIMSPIVEAEVEVEGSVEPYT